MYLPENSEVPEGTNLTRTFFIEKLNEVHFRVRGDRSLLLALKKKFQYIFPNFKHHPLFKAGKWDGKVSMFDMKTNLFPIGHFGEFKQWCDEKGMSYFTNFKEEEELPQDEYSSEIVDKLVAPFFKTDFKLRDYQLEMIRLALVQRRAVFESATGSGKSSTIYGIVRMLMHLTPKDEQIALIVPNIMLVDQMASDFLEYGWDKEDFEKNVDLLHGETSPFVKFDKRVIITTWQSLQKKPDEFFQRYGSVLVDEVHLAKAQVLQSILTNCVNAKYRIGVTGTLPKEELFRNQIFAYLGGKSYEKRAKDLIKDGVLSDITICNLLIDYPEEYRKESRKLTFQSEEMLIEKSVERNKIITKIIKNIKPTKNILVLIKKREHLSFVSRLIKDAYPDRKTHIIHGDVSDREDIRKAMEVDGGQILIATYGTFSTGVNIKRLHHIIFASSYKAKAKVLQSIGRGLRKYSDKDRVVIWDLIDDLRYTSPRGTTYLNALYKQWLERLNHYESEGFEMKTAKMKLIDNSL